MIFSKRESLNQILVTLNSNETQINDKAFKNLFSAKASAAPWYVHLLLILGSWLGVLLIAIYIAIKFRSNSSSIFLVLGVLLSIGAIFLYRFNSKSNFAQHLSIPISIFGIMALSFAIEEITNSERMVAVVIIFVELAIFIFNSDPVRRFLCSLSIPMALAVVVYSQTSLYPYQIPFMLQILVAVYLWENQSKLLAKKHSSYLVPTMYSVIVGLLILLLFTVYRDESLYRVALDHRQWWLTTLTITLAFFYVIKQAVAKFNNINNYVTVFAVILVLLIAILTYHSPGVLASLLVLVMAYSHGSKLLFSIAATFLLIFISAYYYNLSISLLVKSVSLMASGVILLAAAWFMRRTQLTERK